MRKNQLFNVAEYIRLSREDGDKAESDSIGNQRKLITDYLRDRDDFVLYDTYIDDGFTGTNFKRPAFQKMIADIEDGRVNCVIVKDLSRFGRDYIDTGKYLERYFPEHNVRFISITDNIDSMKQAYDMLLPIKNIFNEQYARDISKKVHASMTTKQKAGEFIGAFASFGYKKSPANRNKLIVDEYAAEVVRKIFQLYIEGYGKIRIAKMLNEEGIPCPSEYKKLNGENYHNCNRLDTTNYWTYSTIHRILQNEMYIGNMVQGMSYRYMHSKARMQDREDWYVIQGTHEPIISKDVWDKAQLLLKRRTRTLDLESNTSIFAGFLKCGDCGRALCKKVSNGYTRYCCGTYVRHGKNYCTPHTISHLALEEIVLDDLRTIIRNIDDLSDIMAQQKLSSDALEDRTNTRRTQINEELNKIRKLKKEVYEDYKEELISRDEYINYRQDYIRKEDLLSKQLEQLEVTSIETDSDTFETVWKKRLSALRGIEHLTRDIVVEMIHEIKVYENNKITITYNFSDELDSLFKNSYPNEIRGIS